MNKPVDTSSSGLVRVLGPATAIAVVVGTVIGSGVFKKPQVVADNVPYFGMAALVWVLGGTLALLGALTLSEVAVIFPKAGGNYVFLREAYGRLAGFLWGWVEFWMIRGASLAALATIFTESLHNILSNEAFQKSAGLHLQAEWLDFWPQRAVTIAVILALTAVNIRGVRWGGFLQLFITLVKVGSLLGIMALPFIAGSLFRAGDIHPEATPAPHSEYLSPVWPASLSAIDFGKFGAALLGVLWAYHGWMNVAPWMKSSSPRPDSRGDRALTERLRSENFHGAVIFTVYSQSPLAAALCCYLADIPLRLAHCRENPYQLLTHWVPETEPQQAVRHEVRRQLDLVAEIGCTTADERMRLAVPEAATKHVRRVLDELGLDRRRSWVVVHPGASAPSRRYPPEGFARAARLLALEHGRQIVFVGGQAERVLVDEIRSSMGLPAYSLAGRLNLAELAALLALAPVLVANNSGPVHVAAAVGTPVVDLYALTNPQHTPWGVPHRVLSHDVPCKYCYKSVCPEGHHHCLRLVPPEAIVRAVCELIDSGRTGTLSDRSPTLLLTLSSGR